MDWNGNNVMRPFPSTSRPADHNSSFSFLFNYDHNYPGMEVKYPTTSSMETQQQMMMVPGMDNNQLLDKKKRLTSDQLDSLETSFQEDIKLDPDRKMKMARELGLQPRQIAVWFQNRRARWKNKQLERLYDMLKQDFDLVTREKQKLQDEVIKLKTILREQAAVMSRKPMSTGYTDQVSGEDTVESTSIAIPSSDKPISGTALAHHQFAECNYVFNANDYNPASSSSPYWGTHVLPSYP